VKKFRYTTKETIECTKQRRPLKVPNKGDP
jgi:hypothetical protein